MNYVNSLTCNSEFRFTKHFHDSQNTFKLQIAKSPFSTNRKITFYESQNHFYNYKSQNHQVYESQNHLYKSQNTLQSQTYESQNHFMIIKHMSQSQMQSISTK
jgi:hypothetical protein